MQELLLYLLIVALWFILRGYLFYVLPCVIFVLVFFSPFSTAITLLGKERANHSAFVRLFNLCLFGWFCRFPRPLGVWEGLRFVAFPGLFSYPFFVKLSSSLNK